MAGQFIRNSYFKAPFHIFNTSYQPNVPGWVSTLFFAIYGFSFAFSILTVLADVAGKAPRAMISAPVKTQLIDVMLTPSEAISRPTQKQLDRMDREVANAGKRSLSMPCNEGFRQDFLRQARALLMARSDSGSFSMVVGRMGSTTFSDPADAQDAIETALSAGHVRATELTINGNRHVILDLMSLRALPTFFSGGPVAVASDRATALCRTQG